MFLLPVLWLSSSIYGSGISIESEIALCFSFPCIMVDKLTFGWAAQINSNCKGVLQTIQSSPHIYERERKRGNCSIQGSNHICF
jgi:hypothetical protein